MFLDKKDKTYNLGNRYLLLGINRLTLYYKPKGINQRDKTIMTLPDEKYTKYPFYGTRKMKKFLNGKDIWQAAQNGIGYYIFKAQFI